MRHVNSDEILKISGSDALDSLGTTVVGAGAGAGFGLLVGMIASGCLWSRHQATQQLTFAAITTIVGGGIGALSLPIITEIYDQGGIS